MPPQLEHHSVKSRYQIITTTNTIYAKSNFKKFDYGYLESDTESDKVWSFHPESGRLKIVMRALGPNDGCLAISIPSHVYVGFVLWYVHLFPARKLQESHNKRKRKRKYKFVYLLLILQDTFFALKFPKLLVKEIITSAEE